MEDKPVKKQVKFDSVKRDDEEEKPKPKKSKKEESSDNEWLS